jgi:cell division septum initiation protein DivIVA
MLKLKPTPVEAVPPATIEDEPAGIDDATAQPAEPAVPTAVQDSSTSPRRLLELAAVTADRLVADAHTEAESVVSSARAEADAILAASRTGADRIATEIARTRDEQTAELARERARALAGLVEEKTALEEQIARLRQLQSDHRRQLRDHLSEQLSLLDAAVPEPPVVRD